MSDVDLEALSTISAALERGKAAIDGTESSAPSSVDAGVMSAWVLERLTEVTAAAASLATGMGVSAANVEASRASYQTTDDDVAGNLTTSGPR